MEAGVRVKQPQRESDNHDPRTNNSYSARAKAGEVKNEMDLLSCPTSDVDFGK